MSKKWMGIVSMLALAATAAAGDWPMWGGTIERNMVNPKEKGIPAEWDIEAGKNIKWRAELGSQSYGNPTIADGKVFVTPIDDAIRIPSENATGPTSATLRLRSRPSTQVSAPVYVSESGLSDPIQ